MGRSAVKEDTVTDSEDTVAVGLGRHPIIDGLRRNLCHGPPDSDPGPARLSATSWRPAGGDADDSDSAREPTDTHSG
jgi:hypothetical protein